MLRQPVEHVEDAETIIAERAAPAVERLAFGGRVAPEHLAGLVAGVAQQARRRVQAFVVRGDDAGHDVVVGGVLRLAGQEPGGVFDIEGIDHVDAVQPDLVGIDFLEPEGAGLGARLSVKLALDLLYGLAVFFVARLVVEVEKGFGGRDLVRAVAVGGVALDGAVVGDDAVVPLVDEVVDGGIPVRLEDVQIGTQLHAGGVAPFETPVCIVQIGRVSATGNLGMDHLLGKRVGLLAAGGENRERKHTGSPEEKGQGWIQFH